MQEASLRPGEILAGKYRLTAPLGHGGMGVVWRADHLVLSSPVALKLIHAAALGSEAARARFLREAQAAAALRSPHVLSILDFGFHGETPFIVMELLEGEPLGARLSRVGRLPPDQALRVITHVARAIEKAHAAGIVHRDLKPDNVFLVQNGDEEIAKVLDFGIAKVSDAQAAPGTETAAGAVLGSPHYMSPEQARGRADVDSRSDLWSLGVIAYECLLGSRPFDGPTLGDLILKICAEPLPVPSTIGPVPYGFDDWFSRALQRDPNARFQSATEMSEALRAVVGGTQSLPPPSLAAPAPPSAATWTSQPHSLPVPPKNSGLVVPLAIGALAIALLGIAGVAALVFWPRAEEATTTVAQPDRHSALSAAPSAPAAPAATTAEPGKTPSGVVRTSDAGPPRSVSSQVQSAQKQAADAKVQAANARAQAEAAKKKALESIGK
jgi:eukaryotic-like serine/threonine-protein kinase